MCRMKFNKLNFVRRVAGTKYPPNWCCTSKKVSVYTRGHAAATYPWDMYPQNFHMRANVVILSLLHVPATRTCYMSLQCALHKFFVAATCRCNMSLQHDPTCLVTFNSLTAYTSCIPIARHFQFDPLTSTLLDLQMSLCLPREDFLI